MSGASPFAGTASHYRFRAPYPPAALDFIRAELALDRRSRVLDLGCGPGTLAIPLSRGVAEVVAVDADAEMLAEGARAAGEAGRTNIRWLRSRAEDLSPSLGRFRAVTLGQSFHWMDRDRVLRRLSALVDDGGGLALVGPGRRRPQESWEELAHALVARYLGPRGRHPAANPEPENEPALRRAAWLAAPVVRQFASELERDAESVLGCVFSLSTSAKPLFGALAPAFERELREALGRLAPSGVLRERLETEVVLVRKAAPRA